MVNEKQLDMGLHSNPIDEFLFPLDNWVIWVTFDTLTLSHLDPLLGLLDRVSCELHHLL